MGEQREQQDPRWGGGEPVKVSGKTRAGGTEAQPSAGGQGSRWEAPAISLPHRTITVPSAHHGPNTGARPHPPTTTDLP